MAGEKEELKKWIVGDSTGIEHKINCYFMGVDGVTLNLFKRKSQAKTSFISKWQKEYLKPFPTKSRYREKQTPLMFLLEVTVFTICISGSWRIIKWQ